MLPLIAEPAGLLPAREQMAVSLGWHIILAAFGVAFPAMIFVVHRRGLGGDATALRLAKRWSIVAAALFAIGAVLGLRHLPRDRRRRPAEHALRLHAVRLRRSDGRAPVAGARSTPRAFLQLAHMWLGAYMLVGFLVAGVYAAGLLRGGGGGAAIGGAALVHPGAALREGRRARRPLARIGLLD